MPDLTVKQTIDTAIVRLSKWAVNPSAVADEDTAAPIGSAITDALVYMHIFLARYKQKGCAEGLMGVSIGGGGEICIEFMSGCLATTLRFEGERTVQVIHFINYAIVTSVRVTLDHLTKL